MPCSKSANHCMPSIMTCWSSGLKAGTVHIITRTASPGEKLTTLDGVERTLDESTVLVCDNAGPLSIAGIMGGAESEVYDAAQELPDARGIESKDGGMPAGKASVRGKSTVNILLEGAAWNFINIRKTARTQSLPSEASYRFSRGVHPSMAEPRCTAWPGTDAGLGRRAGRAWSGGCISAPAQRPDGRNHLPGCEALVGDHPAAGTDPLPCWKGLNSPAYRPAPMACWLPRRITASILARVGWQGGCHRGDRPHLRL